MGFGAGVLISAVAFDLVEEAAGKASGHGAVIAGIFAGCACSSAATGSSTASVGPTARTRRSRSGSALAIVLGTVLDGIPESMVIGLTIFEGGAVGAAYLIAVFISNLPKAISSTAGLPPAAGRAANPLALDRDRADLRTRFGRRLWPLPRLVTGHRRLRPCLRGGRDPHHARGHDDARGVRARRQARRGRDDARIRGRVRDPYARLRDGSPVVMPFGRCDRRGGSRSCESDERRTRTGGDLRTSRERAQGRRRLVPLGPLPERAPMGHGARGLQRGRHRVGVPSRTTTSRSRAYRWGEDGLAGFSDIEQRLCLALTLWNGRDPILKERIFGLTGNEGNHGEDAKEYWWYLDALPSHAWNRWRYHYPQREFPYADLVAENGRRGKLDPEYRAPRHGHLRRRPLLDRRGALRQGRPARPPHVDLRHERRAGHRDLHVLPTAWYRNTWSWDEAAEKPELRAQLEGGSSPSTHSSGRSSSVSDGEPVVLLCENETNTERLFGSPVHAVPEGRDQRPRRRRERRASEASRARRPRSGTGRQSPPARARRAHASRPPTDSNPWTDFDAVVDEPGGPRPTSSTRS